VLAVRMRGDQALQLSDQRRVESLLEVYANASLESREPGLLEAGGLGPGERLEGEVGERRPAPQRERLARVTLEQPLEAQHVELVLLHPDGVAGRAREDAVGAERFAQHMNVHLQGTEAELGGDSLQIPSIRRSVETASFAWSSSCARSARGLAPPSGTGAPSSPRTSNGPKSLNSTPLRPS
jgi:hypothetical protein